MNRKSKIISAIVTFFITGIITHQLDLAFPCIGCKPEAYISDFFLAWLFAVLLKGTFICIVPFLASFFSKKNWFEIYLTLAIVILIFWNLTKTLMP